MKTLALILMLSSQVVFAGTWTCSKDGKVVFQMEDGKAAGMFYDERNYSDVTFKAQEKGNLWGVYLSGHDSYEYQATLDKAAKTLTVVTEIFIDCLGDDKTTQVFTCTEE